MTHYNCRLCGAVAKPLFVAKGHAIERCSCCDFVQVCDEPDPALLSTIYEQMHVKHSTFRNAAAAARENQRRVDLLRQHVSQNAEVLDAGCAAGDFLELAQAHFRMSGLDISSAAIEVARKRCPNLSDRLWSGRLEDLVGTIGLYDAICVWDVVEHLWEPVSVCRQLFAHLRPGGLLFLSTPDSGTMIAKLMGSRWAFMTPPEHLSLFSAKSFRYLFQHVVPGQIIHHVSQGKWTNLAFILYKLNRIEARLFRAPLVEAAGRAAWGQRLVYVPTGDVQYLAVRKPS